MDYPLPEEEIKILLDLHSRKNINDLNLIQPVFTKETLRQLREKVRTAHLDEKVAGYITQIVNGHATTAIFISVVHRELQFQL